MRNKVDREKRLKKKKSHRCWMSLVDVKHLRLFFFFVLCKSREEVSYNTTIVYS